MQGVLITGGFLIILILLLAIEYGLPVGLIIIGRRLIKKDKKIVGYTLKIIGIVAFLYNLGVLILRLL